MGSEQSLLRYSWVYYYIISKFYCNFNQRLATLNVLFLVHRRDNCRKFTDLPTRDKFSPSDDCCTSKKK